MKKLRTFLCFLIVAMNAMPVSAQTEQEFETDPLILKRLAEWQDLKFGFMMHWGMYAQWSVVESWSICNEPWISRNGEPYTQYKERYQKLNETFNPTAFDPVSWAELAQEAGMRYVVFTTKHHDGFCMFETNETSYSISDPTCPFSKNPKADVTKAIVDAFRAEGFWTGLYFSKADWHHPDYWAPEWATPDRNVNYDPTLHPERWQRFCDFTYNQLEELTTNYGDIDILWLDGGWIRPEWSLNDEYREWLGCQGWIQNIDMNKIAKMTRRNNPDLIIVDRTVHGKYENYQTPEQLVPDSLLPFPWETCMSMGNSWSYVETDTYKSTNQLIHYLVDIIAKGGNYLLNVGPDPKGELPPTAIERMKAIGAWMKTNGIAIYDTRPIYPYCFEKLRFTQDKKGNVNAFYLLDENETLPETIHLEHIENLKTGKKKVLGRSEKVELKKTGKGYSILVPEKLRNNTTNQHAVVFVL